MIPRRCAVRFFLVLALLLALPAGPVAATDNTTEPECLKGTVGKVTDDALYLKETTFPDETLGKRDVRVLLDKETVYFDGPRKVNRAALQPGHLVLVRCGLAGKDRKATLVRIIGGKRLP